jgi:hypothetical protein
MQQKQRYLVFFSTRYYWNMSILVFISSCFEPPPPLDQSPPPLQYWLPPARPSLSFKPIMESNWIGKGCSVYGRPCYLCTEKDLAKFCWFFCLSLNIWSLFMWNRLYFLFIQISTLHVLTLTCNWHNHIVSLNCLLCNNWVVSWNFFYQKDF